MQKLYYANVLDKDDLSEYFESKCSGLNGEIIKKEPFTDDNGKSYICYIFKIEEGIVDPKYEIKD